MSDKMAQPPWIELIIPTGQLCQQARVKNLRRIDGGDTHFIEVGAVKVLEARIKDLRAALEFYGEARRIDPDFNRAEWVKSMSGDLGYVADQSLQKDDKARGDDEQS